MLGIVLSHWGGHGSWEPTIDNAFLFSKVYLQLTQFFGEVGNCLFVLITGYFCAFRETINKKSIIRLVVDVKFYTFSIWLTLLALGIYGFSIIGLVTALFPFIFTMYWFILPYLVVFAISPWLNYILASSSPKTLWWFFGCLIAVELILPMIKASTVSSNVGLFVLIYCVGAMMRRSEKFSLIIKKYKWCLVGFGYICAISSLLILDILTIKLSLPLWFSSIFVNRFAPLPLVSALGLFVVFSSFTFHSGFINRIATSAFSVYLISEHPRIHPWFWKVFFDNMTMYNNTPCLVAYSVIQCLIVMIVCIIIDTIYKRLKHLLLSVLSN